MDGTRTSVKDVIPDVGERFGLDKNVVNRVQPSPSTVKYDPEISQSFLTARESSRLLATALQPGPGHLGLQLSHLMETKNLSF